MFSDAAFQSLLLAAICLVSRAVPHERHGEDKASQVSLTPPAGDLLQINSSEEDRRLTPAAGSGPSFSSRLLDATDTWTEADRLRTEEVSVLPSSQDVGTEATMSSEDLPLIFEPLEAGASSEPSVAMTPAAVTAGDAELERMVSMDTDRTSSDVRLSGTLETSGVREPITESHPAEEHYGTTQRDDITQALVVSEAVHLPASKPKTDTDDPKIKEKPDEDEEDEEMDSEEEEESEEDLTESTIAPHRSPPYGLIPPPPVWVQRNQGLVRSWVELIREKAGYVSGMLAPVGIGIAGALLLFGALYSIRVIHRKRRNSFKHQRRKPPREVLSGPDNTMLLADSSEDEF
ncbi:uncharacterized protein C14orf37 homolog isoform X2 [Sinocyclocheilus rhinocerous]|uniref:uncharacterized protein C14orf37 homolog isoform X2 n=1 Tax=Sinocyclocheilus rhinocerous TaxID=307959 RepID=UPI0007B808F7|nr:PREDICTED: uncharacterized protein C14orf37 homolog isoform X2 [Sinocyclocheilus rhinocerous]